MRVTLVTLGTTISTMAVIANAFYQKKQFYPSIVYLTKSNPSIAVLYAQVFVLVLLFGKAMRKIFFGQLRAAEVEHLIEKFWYVITETCLAFTVFRDDFSPKFVALFTFLLFTKAFHWLIEDRVDYMERSPVITTLFHLRVCSLLMMLGTIDAMLIHHALKITIASGASVQMVFGFEYAILLMMVVAIMMKYILHSIDYLSEHPWENKNVYLLYAELITGFIKCVLYIVFVGIMVKIHTFPLFAIRPMYLTIRGFKKSLSDVILSRRAIAYMNTRFPDATEEELQQQDSTCIICREQMTSGKKLPCNHIFHAHCLRSWFQRQQSCPTCRLDVLSQGNAASTPPQSPPQPPPNVPPPVSPPSFIGMPPVAPQPNMQGSSMDANATGIPTSMFPPPASSNHFMAGVPPFFMTPPFMGAPFAPPVFPSSNLDLSNLTPEQLQQMEGQERENIEARIHVLKNVHSLLDAAIIQLNQYSQVITMLNSMAHLGSTQSPTTSTDIPPEVASSTAAGSTSIPENTTVVSAGESTILSDKPSTSVQPVINNLTNDVDNNLPSSRITTTFDSVENLTATLPNDESKKDAPSELDNSTENELRRRRLEKFESVKKEEPSSDTTTGESA